MGFSRHLTMKCHTCKTRRAFGGAKHSGSYEQARRAGWKTIWLAKKGRRGPIALGHLVWLCPACARRADTKATD